MILVVFTKCIWQVLYNMMSVFAEMEAHDRWSSSSPPDCDVTFMTLCRTVTETHVLLGCASFFTVAFGGLAIGLLLSLPLGGRAQAIEFVT